MNNATCFNPSPALRAASAALLLLIAAACDRRAPEPGPAATPPAPAAKTEPDIFDAIRVSDAAAFDAWIADPSSLINLRGAEQTTPLIETARYGRTLFLRPLLERGADPKLADLNGHTALHIAARDGRTEICRLLVEAGADPVAADFDGLTPFDLAMMMGHQSTADYLVEARARFLARPVSETVPEDTAAVIPEAVLLSTDFRTWTSASGQQIEAAFIQSVFDMVVLQQPDGAMVRIALNRLAPADQVLARQLSGIDPHALARVRPQRVTAAKKTDSIAADIGDKKGWTVLESCRLLKTGSNDGDSFHVIHDGKEYIFRLYLVDAAETDNAFPDRVKDQARYFRLDEKDTLRLGREAAKFTTSVLASGSFTVYTRWEDARGNSSLPRYYAMVETSHGDLDELLTREGLVRQYGMPIDGRNADRKQARLKRLEQEARSQGIGAWGRLSETADHR